MLFFPPEYCINHSLMNLLRWFWCISGCLHLQIGFRLLQMNRCTLSLIDMHVILVLNPFTCREEVRWEGNTRQLIASGYVANFRPVECLIYCGWRGHPKAGYWAGRNIWKLWLWMWYFNVKSCSYLMHEQKARSKKKKTQPFFFFLLAVCVPLLII